MFEEEDAPVVILGYIDKILTQELDKDPYTTKFGGNPCYFDESQKPKDTDLNCRACNGPLFLLLQAYSPLVDLLPSHERVVMVFICPNEKCNREPTGWKVLRFQTLIEQTEKKESSEHKEEKNVSNNNNNNSNNNSNSVKKDDWGVNEDDWGVNGSDDWGIVEKSLQKDNNNNTSENNNSKNSDSKKDDWGVNGSDWGTETETNTTQTSDIIDKDMQDLLKLRNVSLHNNGNSKKKGKEFKEKKVEHLVTASKDQLFLGHLVSVEEEPYFKKSKKSGEDGDDLRRLGEFDQEDDSNEWGDEEYEGSQDKTFRRFLKRINLSPTQCVRYSFSGVPLLPGDLPEFSRSKSRMEIALQNSVPKCSLCGGRRVFELQLLSTIIFLLHSFAIVFHLNELKLVEHTKSTRSSSWSFTYFCAVLCAFPHFQHRIGIIGVCSLLNCSSKSKPTNKKKKKKKH